MPMSQHRRSVAAILVALFAALVMSAIPFTARADSSGTAGGSTNPIVQVALSYVGQSGGQCWTFAKSVVQQATGIEMGFDYRLGYLDPLAGPGAIEVSVADAQPGDIIQIANDANTSPDADYPGLHTSIIVKNNGDGTFEVVDSNYNFDEMVTEHDGYNPAASAARYGIQFHIYRFSTNGQPLAPVAQASSAPLQAGDQVVVHTGTDVLNLRPTASTSQAPIAKLADGTVLTVTGSVVNAGGIAWLPVQTASGQQGWVDSEWVIRQAQAANAGQVKPVMSFHAFAPMVIVGD